MAGLLRSFFSRGDEGNYDNSADRGYDDQYDPQDEFAQEYSRNASQNREFGSRGYTESNDDSRYTQDREYNGSQQKVVPFKAAPVAETQVVLLRPDSLKNAKGVCDHLKEGHIVICNIEDVDPKVAQRVIDYISGGAFALEAGIKAINTGSKCFVAVPKGVSIDDNKVAPAPTQYPTQDFKSYSSSRFG